MRLLKEQENLKQKVLYDFILEVIVRNWASKNSLFIKKETLDQEVIKIIKNYAHEDYFFKELSKKKISFFSWKKQLHFMLLKKEVLKRITKNTTVSKKEISTWYKKNKHKIRKAQEIKIAQILVPSQRNINYILKALEKVSFSYLAKKYSKAPESTKNGVIGWVTKTNNRSDLFFPAFQLKKGEISPIVKSIYGYHIFKVLDIRSQIKYNQLKKIIKLSIENEKKSLYFKKWADLQVKNISVFLNKRLIQAINLRYNEIL